MIGVHLFGKQGVQRIGQTFTRCLAEHPEAWLDGSVPELCRAWLLKLDGKLTSPDREDRENKDGDEEAKPELEEVKKEIDELAERLRRLKKLLREMKEEE